ncbi:binding-protein-dependent transport system inner membrane protein [Paenibacillus sp. FSL R7-277]|uniref:Multiple sugar transport system permease protein n=1 Tax=Paenibacillus silagei TaxID=1670801 RepID=A0ABS4NSC2_9BACL|nr:MULTISPECIES: carbohydrate ABC transporter permease [Paenibacillus]ETT72927.1 binding-protein-dependent transport system inner membrane protein [Paenibacillus sp. FSL R7-277]MBP2112963.1 multiple sugar transport system permease protein [Paenibacillus silagei]OMF99561.1 ABC transporter permease [Paenibacillus sp. FSL R7-0333]
MGKAKKTGLLLLAILIALFVLLPLVWMLSTAFKNDFEALSGRMNFLPKKPTLDNFVQGLSGELMNTPILRWIVNSLSVGIAGTAIVLLIDSMAAFALARLPDLPLRRTLLAMFIASLMIPGVLTFLPMYIEFNTLGLINTYQALILPATAGAFGVFLLYQFFVSFPKEIEEAARIDGVNKWNLYRRILLPSAVSIMTTLGIFTFMGIYNDFVWPLYATTSPEMRTITAGIAMMATGSYTQSYGKLMAMTTIAALPVLILFIAGQKSFVRAITSSGVK